MLGLTNEETLVDVPAEILVYPRVVALPERLLPPVLAAGQMPMSSTSRKGEGSGFFGVREYREGDPLRHVHWRTAARVGRLAVIEWEAEESRDTILAIETRADSERDLGPATTLDLAAGLAASLAPVLLQSGDSLRLLAPGTARWTPSGYRGTEALPDLLDQLARMKAGADRSVAAELRQMGPQILPGSLVCWFTGSPEPELLETARYLTALHMRPVVYALLDVPNGVPHPSDAVTREVQNCGVPVIRLYRDDETVRQLIS
jgi:uncharacterized protein (DUF58 family)